MLGKKPMLEQSMNAERLGTLLERTVKFHEAVHLHAANLAPVEGVRHLVAFQAALLSLEHAAGAIVLIDGGLFPSAYTLMRSQYECLVRGIWLLYSASEDWVERLSEPLTLENAKRANEGPMLAEMLKELDASPDSPKPIIGQLRQYKDATWKAMSSYVHGGLHPLSRLVTGYPPQLTYDVVRNSNAVIALTTQLVSILSGDSRNMEPVRRFHIEFADCLPILSNG
jgi:hypothetical protein